MTRLARQSGFAVSVLYRSNFYFRVVAMVTLESGKLFAQLPSADMRKLREAARELQFKTGQQIFKEGDPGDGVYMVKSGAVQISGVLSTGQRQVLSRRGGVRWPASAQSANAERDLCLLTVPGLVAPVARLGQARGLAIGQMLSALGYTGGLGIQSSDGEVIELHRHDGGHVIQSSNWFSSGASGGGLFDASGNLIGILTFRLRGGETHYFAAPVEWVQQLVDSTRAKAAPGNPQATPYWQGPAVRRARRAR